MRECLRQCLGGNFSWIMGSRFATGWLHMGFNGQETHTFVLSKILKGLILREGGSTTLNGWQRDRIPGRWWCILITNFTGTKHIVFSNKRVDNCLPRLCKWWNHFWSKEMVFKCNTCTCPVKLMVIPVCPLSPIAFRWVRIVLIPAPLLRNANKKVVEHIVC